MQLQFWNACQKNVFSHLKVILYKTALCKRQKYWPLPWKSQLSAIVYAVTKCIHFPSGWKPSCIFICGLFIMCCFTASDTSSCMPVSSSIITQASMGRAISLLVRFRCSSRAVPNAGFSVHLSVRWWDEVRMIWVMQHYITYGNIYESSLSGYVEHRFRRIYSVKQDTLQCCSQEEKEKKRKNAS